MTALPRRAWQRARWRRLGLDLLLAVPWLLALATLAHRLGGVAMLIGFLALASAALAMIMAWHWRGLDQAWLLRQLNTQRRDLEDSADLLALAPAQLSEVQALQRARLQRRLHENPVQLCTPWPHRTLLWSGVLAMLALATVVLWPITTSPPRSPIAASTANLAQTPQWQSSQLRIQPPAYTGLPERVQHELSAQAPQGSQLHWTLRFDPEPHALALLTLDGQRLPFEHADAQWTAELHLEASLLYRIEVDGALLDDARLHRLDAIIDRPPQVRVLEPAQGLNLIKPGQKRFDLRFSAEDDYALAASAELSLRLVQGSGENIEVSERRQRVRGEGDAKARRFSHRIDLAALGLGEGDDLIVQLKVSDTRDPQPQSSTSASVILRWPAASASSDLELEGAVQRALPAYFRSQRQIIIDAEALQQQKPRLAADHFLQRSDVIGVDQRVLRLRYGQFLGEEAEGAPAGAGGEHEGHADHGEAETTGFGEIDNVLENFGHTHDEAEAATLLDPQTRAVLKKALDAMWQSELHLRQGRPDAALPFAYRALGFIKQVQQADRLYLARVGSQLPPIDASRRLSGKRDGIAARADALRAAPAPDASLTELWQALAPQSRANDISDRLDAALAYLQRSSERMTDTLGLQAAIDDVRRQTDCAACRERLRAQLWPRLPRPVAQVPRHAAPDDEGARYLDALDREAQP
ncbi:MAG TPA: hypothetical protein VFN29_00350 [Chiayiivirga sp.]|nr:hypothetical protein [Chiayiivirga sp.]